jgi:hypothetical protein
MMSEIGEMMEYYGMLTADWEFWLKNLAAHLCDCPEKGNERINPTDHEPGCQYRHLATGEMVGV